MYICSCTEQQNIINNAVVMCICIYGFYILYYSNERSEERLPNIMWCRDPFMENLNEIEALNDIKT